MHKRLRHFEMHDDDSYEMLFTGYLSLDLYYALDSESTIRRQHLIYFKFLSSGTKKCSFMPGIKSEGHGFLST